jgi:hypothetical protein
MAGRNKRAAEAYLCRLVIETRLAAIASTDDKVVRDRMHAVIAVLREPIYETRLNEPLFPELTYGRKK